MRVNSACSRVPGIEPLLLIEEISHRVYNEYAQAIAGIRAAARNAGSSAARGALESAAARLVQFADAHRALQAPRENEEMDLAGHLRTLCAVTTAATLRDRDIHITLDAKPTILLAGRCWRVALIVAELITNSVRHGFQGQSGEIRVAVSHTMA
jgi:two-component sensor histidine kinase